MTSQNNNDIKILASKLDEAQKQINLNTEEGRFEGVFNTITEIINFLKSTEPNLNTKTLHLLLAEITNIYNGAKPSLLKRTEKLGPGRPISTPDNSYKALKIAAIELMIDSGIKPNEAIKKAASITKESANSLRSQRKELKSNKFDPEITKLMYRFKKKYAGHNGINLLKIYKAFPKIVG